MSASEPAPRRKSRAWLYLLIIIALAVVAFDHFYPDAPQGKPPSQARPPSGAKPVVLTSATFDKAVASGVSLVDFWADWCGPCKMLAPTVDNLAQSFDGKAGIYKLDIDAHPELAARFAVSAIPTLIIFKNGEVAETLVGVLEEEAYVEALNRLL